VEPTGPPCSASIHQVWPRVTVFIDSRSEVYGPELLEEFGALRQDRRRARAVVDRYEVDLVLMAYPAYPAPVFENAGILGAVEGDPEPQRQLAELGR
jgi:hypothetical protein